MLREKCKSYADKEISWSVIGLAMNRGTQKVHNRYLLLQNTDTFEKRWSWLETRLLMRTVKALTTADWTKVAEKIDGRTKK